MQLVARREPLEALRADWDALARTDTRDGFFRTAAWYLPWLDYIEPDREPFVITARRSDDSLVGLAPLCRMEIRRGALSLSAVGFGGRDVVSGDYLDIPAAGNGQPVVAAILQHLWEQRSSWGLFVGGEVLAGGPFETEIERWARKHRLAVRRQEERLCPYIELPNRFDDYLKTLSESMRYHVRRRTRDIVDKLGARVEVWTTPEQIKAGIDLLTRLHVARWRRDGEPGTLGRPGYAQFLYAVCTSAAVRPRLYVLRHAAQPVAALLAFHFAESALFYQAGWDPESPLARLSPGVVLMRHSIEDAIASGLRYYDFLRGDESYKFRWTTTARTTTTLLVARSPLARAYVAALNMKTRLRGRIRRAGPATVVAEGVDLGGKAAASPAPER
jgi:CelD/BcsL family acetyltransferase involved in cellulose biosynthesis